MPGIALHIRVIGLCGLVASACSFDPTAGGGGGGGDGAAGGSDGAPDRTDGARATPDGAPLDARAPTTALVTCSRTEAAPELDGEATGPWQAATFFDFAATDAELVADVHSGYDFDAEVSFACLHDDDNLYLFADVVDSRLVSNSLSLREDDGVVFFLDGSGDRDGDYGEDDHALVITAEAETWDYGPGDLVPTGEVVGSDAGYRIEVALDKNAVASPLPGELGFNVAIIDDDGMGNSDRDLFALRHVPEPPACDDCCDGQAQPWCDTSVLGSLALAE